LGAFPDHYMSPFLVAGYFCFRLKFGNRWTRPPLVGRPHANAARRTSARDVTVTLSAFLAASPRAACLRCPWLRRLPAFGRMIGLLIEPPVPVTAPRGAGAVEDLRDPLALAIPPLLQLAMEPASRFATRQDRPAAVPWHQPAPDAACPIAKAICAPPLPIARAGILNRADSTARRKVCRAYGRCGLRRRPAHQPPPSSNRCVRRPSCGAPENKPCRNTGTEQGERKERQTAR